ncbi:MAG: HAMP domain-containing sensor histidine kinase, partial [Pseudomonadota bacterium]
DLTLNLFIRSLARLVMLVMAAGAIVWFAVSAGLRPLTSLQAAIDQRTPHDLNPIRRAMPIELKGIVGSMNKLFERVALSKKNRERFIGDAAHQLRNPIAAIKTQAETALETNSLGAVKAGLTQILGVANHSAAMINKMLSGASAYALELEQQGVSNLVAMVKQTTSDLAKDAFDNNQEISFSKREDHIPFRGNLVLLGEAVRNLISNAIMHNPAGTVIEVGIEAGIEAGIETSIKTGIEAGALGSPDHIEIYVADTGKAFDGERFALLTQPFMTGSFTTGHHHSGSGLGLSIAKDIAKAHGGELIYKPLPEGGKRIAIILPKLQA